MKGGIEMPRYFFDVRNGHRLVDPAGLDCGSDEEAREQGERIASQIGEDLGARNDVRRVAVINDEGQEIATITIGK
jgi:hypothetical protein